MSKTYDPCLHFWVVINVPKCENEEKRAYFHGTYEIVLHTGKRVWIADYYMNTDKQDVIQVGDGVSHGYGPIGECILSIPAEWCTYHDREEAEGIEMCIDADERLLSYAR